MTTRFLRTAAIALLTLAPFLPAEVVIAASAPMIAANPNNALCLPERIIRVVPLKTYGAVFLVPVEINGTVAVDMIIDSGATDVAVSEEVFRRLEATGAVKDGEKEYQIANGSTVRRATFTIRSLKIDNIVIKDIRASVGPGPLLLGQAFLQRLSSWSIDNAARILILEAKELDYAASAPPSLPPPVERPASWDAPPSTDTKLSEPGGFFDRPNLPIPPEWLSHHELPSVLPGDSLKNCSASFSGSNRDCRGITRRHKASQGEVK